MPKTASTFQRDILKFLELVAENGGADFSCLEMIMLGRIWVAHDEGEKLIANDLQKLVGLPKATLSRQLAYLEEELGFIRSIPDPADHRRKLLLPTDRLEKINDRMSKAFREYKTS